MKKHESRKVTAKMIAQEAGVGRTTVSFVLNGKAKERGISEETARRILEIAERLKYRPNYMAASLRRQHSGVIGAIIPAYARPWVNTVLKSMCDVVEAEGYIPFVTAHWADAGKEREEIQKLLEMRVEAIICFPVNDEGENYSVVQEQKVPLVLLGETIKNPKDISYVIWDTKSAVRNALNHLIETGRRKVGFWGWKDPRLSHKIRYATYQEVLKANSLEIRDEWVVSSHSEDVADSFSVITHMLTGNGDDRPDAFFTASSTLAMHLLMLLKAMDIRVPEDVSVITLQIFGQMQHPLINLSNVPFPSEQVGIEAAKAAMRLITHPESAPIQKRISSDYVSIRGTTVSMPLEDTLKLHFGYGVNNAA